MVANDYSYVFSPIGDRLSEARLTNHQTGEQKRFKAAAYDRHLYYQTFDISHPQIADLVDLGLAIYIADRCSKRKNDQPCRIHITLPVRNPDFLNQSNTLQLLHDGLYSYTESKWFFTFEQRKVERRLSEQQSSFYSLLGSVKSTEIALWSGGLDSFAGLWQRMSSRPDTRYVLFGTGPNNFILNRQRELFRHMHRAGVANISLVQLPLVLQTPHRMYRNRYQRSRGFVFLLLGAVCAHLEGQKTLYIYENGIGAMNLSFREAEVGLDHARAVNPLSVLKMKDLVSHLFQDEFTFVNPFLFQTKAELCAPLCGSPVEQFVHRTISCDSRPRLGGRPPQCGACSSCLLRRQALAAIGLTDRTTYHKMELAEPVDRLPLEAMLMQLETLRTCFASANPWVGLRIRYPSLVKIVDRLSKATGEASESLIAQVLRLYEQYMREWDRTRSMLDVGQVCTTDQAV